MKKVTVLIAEYDELSREFYKDFFMHCCEEVEVEYEIQEAASPVEESEFLEEREYVDIIFQDIAAKSKEDLFPVMMAMKACKFMFLISGGDSLGKYNPNGDCNVYKLEKPIKGEDFSTFIKEVLAKL